MIFFEKKKIDLKIDFLIEKTISRLKKANKIEKTLIPGSRFSNPVPG